MKGLNTLSTKLHLKTAQSVKHPCLHVQQYIQPTKSYSNKSLGAIRRQILFIPIDPDIKSVLSEKPSILHLIPPRIQNVKLNSISAAKIRGIVEWAHDGTLYRSASTGTIFFISSNAI